MKFFKLNLGFSLVEFSVVMLVGTVLSMASFMSWRLLYLRWQMENYITKLQMIIHYARSAAIREPLVEFCSSRDHHHCDEVPPAGPADWSHELILRSLPSQRIIAIFPAVASPIRLRWAGSLSRNQSLRFESSGFSAGQQGAFYLCAPKGYESLSQALVILRSGRLRLADDYTKLPSVCH